MLANQYVQYGKVQSMLVRDNTAMQCVKTITRCCNAQKLQSMIRYQSLTLNISGKVNLELRLYSLNN